jgi:hypothetical protein
MIKSFQIENVHSNDAITQSIYTENKSGFDNPSQVCQAFQIVRELAVYYAAT